MMRISGVPLAAAIAVAAVPVLVHGQRVAQWTVDATPGVTIGQDDANADELVTIGAGATRLPDGNILVGDRGEFALRIFTPAGRLVRKFGRRGQGPGEVEYLKALLRCGDSLLTLDLSANRVSVFSLDGSYVRSFRFGSPQAGRPPYNSACSRQGLLVHHGWETMLDVKPGVFRPTVPYWLTGMDSSVRAQLGSFPGAERYGLTLNGQLRGTRPLPLGKQPVIALGSSRVYVGTADRNEVLVFDTRGAALAPVRWNGAPRETTSDDIRYAMELEIAANGERSRAGTERAYAELPLPKTLPAYAALVVDTDDNLWVRDYPRPKAPTVRWSVFDPAGRLIAAVDVPTYLQVYEIGRDYILGRFLDPDESIPQIRQYRLNRRGTG